MRTLTIQLPDAVYARLQQAAHGNEKRVGQVAIQMLSAALPPDDTLPQVIQQELRVLESLSDDVLWAVATRMQADRDLVVISGSLGAMLDPSADERGVTAKLGIDATRPFGEPFGEKLVMDPAKMAWARALVDRLGG